MDEAAAKAKIERLGGYEKLYRIKLEADYLAKLAYDGANGVMARTCRKRCRSVLSLSCIS